MLRIFNISIVFIASVAFLACASPGYPTGGPKDETPPEQASATPENFSTQFKARNITVKFDENIALNNLNQQLTVSPPMAKPDIVANNRNLTIRLKDTLRANTTYTISFGNALVDFNEGNVLPNYQYVFSTGESVDSLSVAGEILDAYTLQPLKDISIVLLSKIEDLSSKAEKPLYVAKANENGLFQVNYLHEGCYFLAAIKDGNNDWTYDSLQEEVGFLTSCVSPKFAEMPVFPDSCSTADSLLITDSIRKFHQEHQVLLFKQKLPQSVSKSEFIANAVISLEFRNPAEQVKFRILQPEITPEKYYLCWDHQQQKTEIFLTEKGIKNLLLYVEDGDFRDTLKILNTRFEESISPLKISLTSGMELAFFDTLKLTFNAPIREIKDTNKSILLYSPTDTFSLTSYSFNDNRTQITFDAALKPKTTYELMIPDSLFWDYFEQTNTDTLHLKFRTTTAENYARLDVKTINKPAGSCILQVLTEKLEVVEQRIMQTDSTTFPALKPGKYRLRIIVDENQNNRWDSGNLNEKRLPETVFILPKTIGVEANWEYVEEWVF